MIPIVDRHTDRRTDGRTDGWMDGWMDDVVSEVTGTKESMLTSWHSVYSRSEFFVKSIPVILCSLTSSCMQDGERQRYEHGFIKTSPEYWCEFLIPAAGEMTSAHGAPGERGAVELNVSVFEREPLIYNTTAPQLWTHSDCWRNSDGDVLSLVKDTRYIYLHYFLPCLTFTDKEQSRCHSYLWEPEENECLCLLMSMLCYEQYGN